MGISARQVIRFMALRVTEGLIVLLLIMFVPNIPPFCKIVDPIPITSSKPLEGKLALNERLNEVVIWHKGDLNGPEAFADYNGELYTSLLTGDIVKLVGEHITPIIKFGKPCKGFYQERICGRPLGMQFDKDGSLIVADAYYGIFRVNVKTGEKIQLVSPEVEIDGRKPKIPNSVAIASNGDIFWSDSSTEFYLEDGLLDMFADGSGRLIHYDIKTKNNTVLIDNLLFANGVALSEDEEFVIVAETGRSRIYRYYLKNSKKGTTDVFVDGLPGLPDNINPDGQGGFLLPLITARDDSTPALTQVLGTFPLFRKLIARMIGLTELGFSLCNQIYPNEYAEKAVHLIGHFSTLTFAAPNRATIVHVSKTGEIIDSLHGNNKKAILISEAYIFKDELYLGSPFNDFIARIPLSKVGLEHLKKKPQITKIPKDVPTTKQPSTTSTTTPKLATTSAPTKGPTVSTSAPTKAATVTITTPLETPRVTTPTPIKSPTVSTPIPTKVPSTTKPSTKASTTKASQQKIELPDIKPTGAAKTAPKSVPAKPAPTQTQPEKQESKPIQLHKEESKVMTELNKEESKPTQSNNEELKSMHSNKQASKSIQSNKQESKTKVI